MESLLPSLVPALLVAGLALLALPFANPDHPWSRLIGAGLTAVLLLRYLAWRAGSTLPDTGVIDIIAGWAYFAVEALSLIAGLLLIHVLSRTCNRSAEADAHPVTTHAGGPPLIDVFIPTYNEKREILERTIVGALSQEYPRYRVWVLDDGRREWLRELAVRFGAGYLTRADNAHGKAGNMNAAIRQIARLPDPPDVIAVLDADFVATPQFLARAAALMHDARVGLVQTPQHFFNPDPIQLNLGAAHLVPDEQRFFFDVILASKDAHGTAFSCGTSALVRFACLQEIGGFPTESVTEDLLLSIKLSAIGYKTVYLNEPLSFGLAPEGLGEYITQRARWCLGTMQVVRTRWGPLSRGDVPLLMRLHTLDTVLFWIVGSLMRLLGIIVPILYWWTGLVVMVTDLPSIFYYLGPYWISCVIFIAWVSRGTNVPVLAEATSLLMAVDALRASAVGLFGARNQKFKVTAKGVSRDRIVVHWSLLRIFVLLAGATLGGVVLRLWAGPIEDTPPAIEGINLFWSFYNVATLVVAGLICIELPRFRQEERFPVTEPVGLRVDGSAWTCRLRDVSLSGASILVPDLVLAPGTRLRLDLADVGAISAIVVGRRGSLLQVRFDDDAATRPALIRKIFRQSCIPSVTRMRATSFTRIIWDRLGGTTPHA